MKKIVGIVILFGAVSAYAQTPAYQRNCDYVNLSASGSEALKDCPPHKNRGETQDTGPQSNDPKTEGEMLSEEVGNNIIIMAQKGLMMDYKEALDKDEIYQQIRAQTQKETDEFSKLADSKNPNIIIPAQERLYKQITKEDRYIIKKQQEILQGK